MKLSLTRSCGLALLVIVLFSTAQTRAAAQSKKDSIFLALAWNDTTQAMAGLFINKRHAIKTEFGKVAIGGTISLGLTALGYSILASDNPGGPLGLFPLAIGEVGVVFFVGDAVVQLIRLNQYSLRKYKKLLKDLKNAQMLPKFYAKRIRHRF